LQQIWQQGAWKNMPGPNTLAYFIYVSVIRSRVLLSGIYIGKLSCKTARNSVTMP